MAAIAAFPTNWHELVLVALEKSRLAEPSKAAFGLSLPESWKSELQRYVFNGELGRLFGVRSVTFTGKTIGTFDAPGAKEAHKPRKVD